MRTLFLSPHHDDETLFGTFTLLRYRPRVIVCTKAEVQDSASYPGGPITHMKRAEEFALAMSLLGIRDCTGWMYSDIDPDWDTMREHMATEDLHLAPQIVFAPAVEVGGHDQHNGVGQLAHEVFGSRVRPYMTYTAQGRSRGVEVEWDSHWPGLKMRALAAYQSQINSSACRPHFMGDWLTEYYQEAS